MGTMSREKAQEWIEALESGKYPKGKNCLRTPDGAYCCLGVLASISGVPDEQMKSSFAGEYFSGEYAEYTDVYSEVNGIYEDLTESFFGGDPKPCDNLMDINDSSETFDEVIEEIKRIFMLDD